MKVSHKDQAELKDFLGDLRSGFGQEDKLMENKGLIHKYLGIIIDYSIPCKIVFTMFNYLEDVIVEANEDMKNSRLYYSGNYQLFKIDYNSPSLPSSDTELFHCHVVRLLFSSKKTRPDIQACVAFLYTRVKSPTEQDYKKLGRVTSYLKETVRLLLVIGAENREH